MVPARGGALVAATAAAGPGLAVPRGAPGEGLPHGDGLPRVAKRHGAGLAEERVQLVLPLQKVAHGKVVNLFVVVLLPHAQRRGRQDAGGAQGGLPARRKLRPQPAEEPVVAVAPELRALGLALRDRG
eukprot:CAMPEP_0198428266 /NCGR_PEP_ID=MMETSP1452-20131203/6448_1 /TAXON_ID=1181717 /ORGANISM="Synchroma pusillum, Strain CCMP3072" /LENGTH=127 /DNA_ID=CAMNT_0044148657 /DNA_START=51 /DNA_END=430 /DNA_ORIENTATION=-